MIIYATERAATAAIKRQPVGGMAVGLPHGFLVFHDTPREWRLVKRGAPIDLFELIGSPEAVIERVFDVHAARLARLRAAVDAAELALDPPDGGPTIDVEAPDPLPPLPNTRTGVL